jgi:hypothetical protein
VSKLSIVHDKKRNRLYVRERHVTTVRLTLAQRIAIEELKLLRMKAGKPKPSTSDLLCEAIEAVLENEGLLTIDSSSRSEGPARR